MNSGTVRRHRWIDHHDEGHANDAGDRRDIANEIEIEVAVERRADRSRRADHEERIAVRRGIHDRLGTDIAAGTRPILDDERLSETLRQPLPDQACGDVGRAAGGKADDHAHRARGIGLCPCIVKGGRERHGSRQQMQKSTTGNHLRSPSPKGLSLKAWRIWRG
jgi:hypothetical protein